MGQKPYELYEKRRQFPRIIVNMPAMIRFKHKKLEGVVRDVSPDGMQLRIDRSTMQIIHPSGQYITADNAPSLDISFMLTIGNQTRPIRATCSMYYFILLPDTEKHDIACGCQFRVFQGKSKQYLDEYVQEMILPVHSTVLEFLEKPRTKTEIIKHVSIKNNQATELLNELRENGDIVSYGPSRVRKHVRVNTALSIILDKLDNIENEIGALTPKKKQKKKR